MTSQIAQYHALREKRRKLQREADALEQEEMDILYALTKDLTTDKVAYAESGFSFKAERKFVATVRDWPATLDFIKKTGQVDLLQKRLTDSAVKLRWDAGLDVPGVEQTSKYVVTITKD